PGAEAHDDESEASDGAAPPPVERPTRTEEKKGGFPLGAVLYPILLLPGLLAISATVSIWLANRIGATPGGWPELISGIDAFGTRYGLPGGLTPWLFAASIVLFVAVLGLIIHGFITRAAPRTEAPARNPHRPRPRGQARSEEHTSELQSRENLVC